MQAFQAIANANPGPDGHGGGGQGVGDYVARLMTQAGYRKTIQTYKFDYFAYTAVPVLSEVSPTAHDYVVSTDFNPGQSTGTAKPPATMMIHADTTSRAQSTGS